MGAGYEVKNIWTAAAPSQLLSGLHGCFAVPHDYAHGLSKILHRVLLQGAINNAEGVDVRIAANPAQKQENFCQALGQSSKAVQDCCSFTDPLVSDRRGCCRNAVVRRMSTLSILINNDQDSTFGSVLLHKPLSTAALYNTAADNMPHGATQDAAECACITLDVLM